MVKLIIGLGNPGPRYSGTRHNIGFAITAALADKLQIRPTREQYHGLLGQGSWSGQEVAILQPLTYMNRSGLAAAAAVRDLNIPLRDVLVVYDDMDFAVGEMRFRKQGGSGGHNGVKSIIDELGTKEFSRLRIGIGKPCDDAVNYVLGRFTDEQQEIINKLIPVAVEGILCFIENGIDLAMNRFNGNIIC